MTTKIFTVVGTGYFPFEMLTRDQCWPKTEDDAELLSGDFREHHRDIMLETSRRESPTTGAWYSRGWGVMRGEPHDRKESEK